MGDNPFADAIKPKQDMGTRSVHVPPFFQRAIESQKLKEKARNMSRQDMFNNGMLTVEDMDDEELRAGRMRDNLGKIPPVRKTMEMVPRDLYDAMVQEHLQRTNDKFRQMLDQAVDTITGIMLDDTNEPKDRLDAAKYVKEHVMGKTPERVQVQHTKAPWEEMAMEVARTTRAEHAARHQRLRDGAIDAEVVDTPVDEDVSPVHEQDVPDQSTTIRGDHHGVPGQHVGEQTPTGAANFDTTSTPSTTSARPQQDEPILATDGPQDPAIRYPHQTPTHDRPMTNAERIHAEVEAARDLAERRKAAKKRIQDAKKARAIKKAFGQDAVQGSKIESTLVPNEDDPDTGKLKHTLS